MTNPNPFATAPQMAPPVPDAAPAQQQYAPPPQVGYAAPVQHQQPAGIPQAVPGQAWTPQQHEAYGQAQGQPGYAPAPVQQQYAPAPAQGYAPPAPAAPQLPQPFGGQAPAQVQQQAAPNAFAHVQPQAAPSGPGAFGVPQYNAAAFGAPSSGGSGLFPKVRDLEGRLCLFVVKQRGVMRAKYQSEELSPNTIANVAVLDGPTLMASPSAEDPMGVATPVGEVPQVISEMIIGQSGMQRRLKNETSKGRVFRLPKGELEKGLQAQMPGVPIHEALRAWLSQDPMREHQFKTQMFWAIIPDETPQADELVRQFFSGHPQLVNELSN